MVDTAAAALLAATCLHAGFQLAVSCLVYPALARVDSADWARAHRLHSRAVAPLVALVYATVVAAAAWSVVGRSLDAGKVVALAATLVAFAATGLRAAPLHGRLGREGPTPVLLTRLRRADLVRTVAAVAAVAGAAWACLGG